MENRVHKFHRNGVITYTYNKIFSHAIYVFEMSRVVRRALKGVMRREVGGGGKEEARSIKFPIKDA